MIQVCVFDAYGTLFDVHSAVRHAGAALGDTAGPVSALWRTKQLEYTWVRSLMHRYVDFWACTADALDTALAMAGVAVPTAVRDRLLDAYRRLDAYPDVRPALEALRDQGKALVILSNGTSQMLEQAVEAAGLSDLGLRLISVDPLAFYKPDPRVYALVTDGLGVTPDRVSFQSSNAWDIAGAMAFGFRGVWINRGQAPGEYGGPDCQLESLAPLPALLG